MNNPDVKPDLSEAYLSTVEFSNVGGRINADLHLADLRKATLVDAELFSCNLDGANLTGALCGKANFLHASLKRANLTESSLFNARLDRADLSAAILIRADLRYASLSSATLLDASLNYARIENTFFKRTILKNADFEGATVGMSTFGDIDLSEVKGLHKIAYMAPSIVGIDTIYKSGGRIPDVFLRGCGVPEDFITYMRSLVTQSIQFYSCFISYSSKDQDFAQRLHADLQNKGVRCWFAPEDLKIGDKIRDRIDESIRLRDKLLLILSGYSIASDWVEHEVESALEEERQRGQTILFPIRLDDSVMESNKAWAALIRRTRNIGDFRDWKNYDLYQKAFNRLLRDLRASE